ncbi:SAC3/GANP/Nin1/mts3/eIF-3 p25 family [Abeliophyllum distichum]|uniref:SAC3/GANP/Nin1/mts3/eIF-3 p25 family n=1 Tax=Abeliophyllum distichum TaxID=126358 RepID=A0ABD1TGM0_9LAMI
MADRRGQRQRHMITRNNSSSSSSFKSHRPSNPNTNAKITRTNKFATVNPDNNDNIDDPQDIPNLVGTCPFMCPVEERARRERLRDLAVFERLHGNPAKTSSTLAVKKFCRTISTNNVQASDVRPVTVLEDTLNYLLNLLKSDCHFEVVHDFIFDRTRSIRQDLTMQNVTSDQAIHMYERMVKFHIISHHRLPNCGSPNQIELHILFIRMKQNSIHIMCFSISVPDNQGESLSQWFRRVPFVIMKSKEMCFARRILRYFRLGNYKQFIYTTEAEASYLQYCIIEPYISEVRALALYCVNYGGYKLQPYPLTHLSNLLMMQESDLESLCIDCGLQTSTDGIGKVLLSTKLTDTCNPKRGYHKYYELVSERLERLSAELSEL